MADEVGQLCHYILKRTQRIREGADGKVTMEISDAFADVVIYGINLMSKEGVDAEKVLDKTIKSVLERDWVKYPYNGRTA